MSPTQFVALIWPSAVVAIVVTCLVLTVMFHRTLRTVAQVDHGPDPVVSRLLLACQSAVIVGLTIAVIGGVDVTIAAAVGAVASAVCAATLAPESLRRLSLPWALLAGVTGLFVTVEVLRRAVLDDWLAQISLPEGTVGQLALASIGTIAANAVNNLPAYLILEPLTHDPVSSSAMLIGVNTGSLITPWASLATLLWASRCQRAGVRIQWREFFLRGIVVVVLVVPLSTLALAA